MSGAIKLNSGGAGNLILTPSGSVGSDVTMTVPAATGTMIYANSSGNVGIDVTSPSQKLEVNGTVRIKWANGDSNGLNLSSDATGLGIINAGYGGGAGQIAFQTAGTERMRITASGDLQFNSGYGSVQDAFACRAWVNFNASSGTPTIRSSRGISSLSDNGTGDTTVNLSFTMPDVNYSVSGLCNWNVSGNFGQYISAPYAQAPTTSTFRIYTLAYNGSAYDCYQVTLQFVR